MKITLASLVGMALLLVLPASAQFNNPNGILFDAKGNLWLANSGDNNVLELNPSTGAILNTITNGVSSPTRLAFDSQGRLWVTNLGNNTVTTYTNLSVSGAKLVGTLTSSSISRPLGLAVDAYGDVYVADNSTNAVVAFNINGGLIETLTKDKSGFAFTAPGVIVIHGQNIYVGLGPNIGTNAVISYNVGEFLTGDPQEITVFNDNVDTGPTGVAFDSAGNVYISEYTTPSWVKYSPSGKLLLAVKTGVNGPEGIALDKSGNIYVSNSVSNNITVYNPSGAQINTLN